MKENEKTGASLSGSNNMLEMKIFINPHHMKLIKSTSENDYEKVMKICFTFQKLMTNALWELVSKDVKDIYNDERMKELRNDFIELLEMTIDDFNHMKLDFQIEEEGANDD